MSNTYKTHRGILSYYFGLEATGEWHHIGWGGGEFGDKLAAPSSTLPGHTDLADNPHLMLMNHYGINRCVRCGADDDDQDPQDSQCMAEG